MLRRVAGVVGQSVLAARAARTSSVCSVRWASVSAGTVLERYPTTLPPLSEWEREVYLPFHRQVELEKSMLSYEEYTELLEKEEAARQAAKNKGKKAKGQASAGRREVRSEEEDPFVPASVETEADVAGDTKSLQRALAEKLYLLVKTDGKWSWPMQSDVNQETGSIREAAEAGLEGVTKNIGLVHFVSNCPSCVIPGANDDKTFLVRAILVNGEFEPNSTVEDYAWVRHSEFGSFLPKETVDTLSKALY
eukprot:m.74567 g.74567  ORF g.74567 m.74567 type:complete len:250 (-) comp12402_c0_seq1:108-857(-)